MRGFRWFIKIGVWTGYEPNEAVYPTLEECENAIYPEFKEGAGIDEVEVAEDIVTVIRHIKPATIHYQE